MGPTIPPDGWIKTARCRPGRESAPIIAARAPAWIRACAPVQLAPRGPRFRGVSSAFELLVQFLAAEEQRRRAAVRAMVRVLRQVPLFEQLGNLLAGEPVAGLDR